MGQNTTKLGLNHPEKGGAEIRKKAGLDGIFELLKVLFQLCKINMSLFLPLRSISCN
jgi:hypothetical protein